MNITYEQLLRGCLMSFIAHAIMTNTYPELSYEQAWDECSFSLQDGCGMRGTITFQNDFCVGAIRNDSGNVIYGNNEISKTMKNFPEFVVATAKAETLQYLLDYQGNAVVPAVTSVFWCDQENLYLGNKDDPFFLSDILLFEKCILPFDSALEELKRYYNMDSTSIQLLIELLEQKGNDISKKVFLTENQRRKIPGDTLHGACIENFKEINIYF